VTHVEFWRRYLAAHSDPRTRGLHYLGTSLAVAAIAAAAIERDWRWLAAAPIAGYGLAWLGHVKFEHNRPETFGHPAWRGGLEGHCAMPAAEAEVAMVRLIGYDEAGVEVRAVYDDIMSTRGTDWINNFWKVLANDPPTLRRTWESIKEVMAPGALDSLTKELIYLAVSASNGCAYCVASHGAAAKKRGMTPEMLGELMAIVGMANETNSLANGYRVPVDERFEKLF